MADQYWLRVVGYLQPPPAREVLSASGYYHGAARQLATAAAGHRPGEAQTLGQRGGESPASGGAAAEIANGDRLIYFALGPFAVYAVGTATSDPEPYDRDPTRRVVSVQTDIFINSVMKTPVLGGIVLPSGRDLRLLVQQYNYIWLAPEDGQALVERVHTKAGAKD
jgi:hypothetical protein